MTHSVEGGMGSLFEIDVLLPSQFWQNFGKRTELEPEKMLMLAVLEDAVSVFQKLARARDHRFHEAEEWFMEEDSAWPFSFVSICETFGLDPNPIRQELFRWKAKELAKPYDLPAPGKRIIKRVRLPRLEEKRANHRHKIGSVSLRSGKTPQVWRR